MPAISRAQSEGSVRERRSSAQHHRHKSAIPSLTGIRGLAALVVALYHTPLREMYSLRSEVPLINQGYYMVDLFFILSGFILMHVHAEEFGAVTALDVKRFFLLRFFRIYPVHLFIMLCILVFVLCNPDFVRWFREQPRYSLGTPYSVEGFFQTLTLTNRIGLPELGEWNGPTWSLSSELVGYAVFPLAAFAFMRNGSIRLCFLVSLACLATFSAVIFLRGHLGMPRMLFCFIAGVALGRAHQLHRGFGEVEKHGALVSALLAVVVLLIPELSFLSVFFFAALIYFLSLSDSIVGAALESRIALFYGRISFSFYLCHYIVLRAALWKYGDFILGGRYPTLCFGLLLLVPTLIAVALSRFVERPSHRYGRRLAAALSPRPQRGEAVASEGT